MKVLGPETFAGVTAELRSLDRTLLGGMMSPTILDQLNATDLPAEIAALKQVLAEREQEIERLRQLAVMCCPWQERPWHLSH